ncbi:hypothetical protein GQ44DRAFT_729104 [Phaeosphaeriaceae sp. PMI808]|nr:hypothetical protein GQ44DRAFT_729104 [Phaeosphaeriaceae sp. PMI808]
MVSVTIKANKPKGLKEHKKAQKQKVLEKRAAAAVKSKSKVADKIEGASDTKFTQRIHNDLVTIYQPNGSDQQGSSSQKMSLPEALDLHERRKALEAELYKNLESPKEMLARCKSVTSADAEFHHEVEIDAFDVFLAKSPATGLLTSQHAVDKDGWGMIAMHTNPSKKPVMTRSSSFSGLFSLVSDPSATATAEASAGVSQTSEAGDTRPIAITKLVYSANTVKRNGMMPITISQLFATAIAENTPVIGPASTGIRNDNVINDQTNSSSTQLFEDPAIVNYKTSGAQDAWYYNSAPACCYYDDSPYSWMNNGHFPPIGNYNYPIPLDHFFISPVPYLGYFVAENYGYEENYHSSHTGWDYNMGMQNQFPYDYCFVHLPTMPDYNQSFTPAYTSESFVSGSGLSPKTDAFQARFDMVDEILPHSDYTQTLSPMS